MHLRKGQALCRKQVWSLQRQILPFSTNFPFPFMFFNSALLTLQVENYELQKPLYSEHIAENLLNIKSIYQFCVFTVMPSKIEMQTSQYRKFRIWEMKESDLCNYSYARYLGKHFTQIYEALYGNALLVSLCGAQIWLPETNRNICFWVSLLVHEFITWGTHKD